jgi:hypothetical protein
MLDLKESGDIEAHSHVVLLPYLPVGEDGRPLPEEQLLIIGKNRNGSVGSLPVVFDERRLQFADRATFGERSRNPTSGASASYSSDRDERDAMKGSENR